MRSRTTTALALLVLLSGCAGTDEPTDDPTTPEPSTSASSPTNGPTSEPTSDPTSEPASGGTVDEPTVVEPTDALLDWTDTGEQAGARYVRGPEHVAVVDRSNRSVEITTGGPTKVVSAERDRTISEVLMSDRWAVVVQQDNAETRPSTSVAIELATGVTSEVNGPPPASGGSWALTDGDLYYPTYGDRKAYCLATSALDDRNGEDGWCAPSNTGFSGLTAGEHGVGIMTFDDVRPVACRTVNLLEAGVPQPVVGPTECVAWDVAATADGALWSEVPKPRRQEEAVFRASADGTFFDLGPGTTGTALPCGDSVFFVRDPQGPDEPARLMRWTPDRTLEVAYESDSVGNAFLGEPTCGGGVLALSSYGEQGDEMVWANVT